MVEKQLTDKQENQNFFIYLSNREIKETFPMISDAPSSLYKRAYNEINMEYTAASIYERLAVLQEDSWFALSKPHSIEPRHYENFLFIQQSASTEHVSFSAFEPEVTYSSLNEAVASGKELLKKKQQLYPGQVFTVVCAAFLIDCNQR
ncbi:hypothetical protein [Planococcus sp. YIM B11945]|uniref:hypothetical protein n=1 Tax=Planococcus sp. YIM B11945 TaxID=3435410 RepID=UPI003D7D0B8B